MLKVFCLEIGNIPARGFFSLYCSHILGCTKLNIQTYFNINNCTFRGQFKGLCNIQVPINVNKLKGSKKHPISSITTINFSYFNSFGTYLVQTSARWLRCVHVHIYTMTITMWVLFPQSVLVWSGWRILYPGRQAAYVRVILFRETIFTIIPFLALFSSS